MIKKAFWVICTLGAITLVGCGERDAGACAAGGTEAFFKSSIDAYYKRKGQQETVGRYKLTDKANYDAATNWWMVPFDLNGEKLQALISCDGRLEITGR